MLLESLRWDLKSNSLQRLGIFWHLLAIDVAAAKMQRYLAGNAESQCSIICRALSPGAVCWRNHWGVSWEFDESQCHVNVFSCFSMFFYHSSQLRYDFELEFATGIWHLRSVTAKTGQLCLAPCGCPRRPKPQQPGEILGETHGTNPCKAQNGEEGHHFWKKNHHTPDWVLKTIWTEFGLIDLYKILSNRYFETPMLPPKKVISSQGVTLSFSRFATFLWSFVTTHLGKPATCARIFARLQQLQRGRKIYICLPWVEWFLLQPWLSECPRKNDTDTAVPMTTGKKNGLRLLDHGM